MEVKIKSALISVFNKNSLDKIVVKLHQNNVKIYSTGGTKTYIDALGIPTIAVEDITDYPSILGGRVKTLHPKIFGGILSRRDNDNDKKQLKQYQIPEIDLVIVDLYPFEETLENNSTHQEIIEKIDIGGISLIRAAAKNYKDIIVVPSKSQYSDLLKLLEEKDCSSNLEDRLFFANQAFKVSSRYDSAIFNYFDNYNTSALRICEDKTADLRYGENPHQEAKFCGDLSELFEQLNGKELSYNNLLDTDAAIDLISEFSQTTVAVLKHTNACGCASRNNVFSAWKDALAADSISAFGGIIISNTKIDKITAIEMDKIFFEIIIAPEFEQEALDILKKKKNRRILLLKKYPANKTKIRTLLNGFAIQNKDIKIENTDDFNYITDKKPNNNQIQDLLFANILVKHSKSNAIVLVKNQQLIGSGVGQTSRVDATKQAIAKARNFNFDLKEATMASDAFFPFPDCIEIAYNEGINAVIQPGGSIKDNLSVEFCNKNNIAMIMTGIRHFKH